MKQKLARKQRRAHRARARIEGTSERPRLSVHRSLKHVSAQLIDDRTGKSLCVAHDSVVAKDIKTGMERARAVGQALAEKAKTTGITSAVFDRGSYRYHGQVRAVAEGAREAGLKF